MDDPKYIERIREDNIDALKYWKNRASHLPMFSAMDFGRLLGESWAPNKKSRMTIAVKIGFREDCL